MDGPHPVVFPPSFCGEDALTWLPSRDIAPSEVSLEARGVVQIDAFGGAVLRAQAEYHGRYRQQDVFVGYPADSRARAIVDAMLEYDPPSHVILKPAAGPSPRSVLIPALTLSDESIGELLADGLVRQAGGEFRTQLRFLAAHLPELVENALHYGSSSPIGAVVCAMHHRQRDELQLVVCDLGNSLARRAEAARLLDDAIRSAPEGSLQLLVEEAVARELQVRVSLATGPGRLRSDGVTWSQGSGSQVEGFAVSITLPART